MTTVAKTSKNPSTHRCTTHHRQYSATARFVRRPLRARPCRTWRWRWRRSGTSPGVDADRQAGAVRAVSPAPAVSTRGRARRGAPPARAARDRCTRTRCDPDRTTVAGTQQLLYAHPLAGHRADDDEQERPEQHVHAQALPLRLDAAHRRTDEQAGRQPRRGDPEDAQLHVPRARDRVRQELRDAESRRTRCPRRRSAPTTTPRRICTRISAETTQKYLTRARCDGVATDASSGIVGGRVVGQAMLASRCVVRGHHADAGEQDDDADARPDDRVGRGTVADERFVRPVARVGGRVVRTVGRGRPGRPEEEGGELPQVVRIGERARRDGVLIASLREDVAVVRQVRVERLALAADRPSAVRDTGS